MCQGIYLYRYDKEKSYQKKHPKEYSYSRTRFRMFTECELESSFFKMFITIFNPFRLSSGSESNPEMIFQGGWPSCQRSYKRFYLKLTGGILQLERMKDMDSNFYKYRKTIILWKCLMFYQIILT